MDQGELHRLAGGLDLDGDARWMLVAQFVDELDMPGVGQVPRRLALQHDAAVADRLPALGLVPVCDRRANLPVGLDAPAVPILPCQRAIGQRLPELLRRGGYV